jgi:hypothetical protein
MLRANFNDKLISKAELSKSFSSTHPSLRNMGVEKMARVVKKFMHT